MAVMRRTRELLILVIILALAAQAVWLAVKPFLPLAILGVMLISVYGVMFYRKRSW